MKENSFLSKMRPPTILAYQPQINFYYPKQMIATIESESPISQRFEDQILSRRRDEKRENFRLEIEKRFANSKLNKYRFPRVLEDSFSDSLDNLKTLGMYDLREQNYVRKTVGRTEFVGQRSRGTSVRQRIKTEGNQPDEMITIQKKKDNSKNFDAFRMMFGIPSQTDRSVAKLRRPDLSAPRNVKTYSKSPLMAVARQTSNNVSTTRAGMMRTERKQFPRQQDDSQPLNDLIKQYEKLKLKQMDLVTKHEQMKMETLEVHNEKPKHMRTYTQMWMKTEQNEPEIRPSKINYFKRFR